VGAKMVETLAIPYQLCNDKFRFLKIRKNGKEPTYDMKEWQKYNFKFTDTELLNHLAEGGNYAIIGGFGNLILIDSDSEEITQIAESMPETFTIKTGSLEEYKRHYFYIAEKPIKPIRLSKEGIGDLGDVRSVGQYVVAPNSIHPSGNKYFVLKDKPIARISESFVRGVFKKYIDPNESTEIKNFEPELKLRNSKFIKICNVPDYCMKNKLKGNTSKNWKLFPYIVDILHNRQSSIEPYKKIIETQGHKTGAVKGWIKLAREGKLAKSSCKKMQEYLKRFHNEDLENICGKCPLYQKYKKLEGIKENKNFSGLQKQVLTSLALKDRDDATEKIVKEIKKNNFIYTTRDDKSSEMWIYYEGIYVPQGKSFVREFCRNILGDAYTTQLSNNVIAKIETDTFIDHDAFFGTNYVYEIPLLNGILNIQTRELNNYDPKKIFFNKIPVVYDPSAECPNILNHFKTILKTEEEINVMLEIFGYLLLKEYKIEKAVMFVGFGRNGKSKTIELMKKFIGAENTSSLPLRSLNEESFSLSELFGKMANLASDLSKTDLKETGMIKSLIGRDTIQAKRKYLRDLNFVSYAKMIFAANELPKIYDTTDGFWTKWILIEFPYKFISKEHFNSLNEKDKENHRIIDIEIIEKISTEEELSGLLNYALDGLDRILEQKDFSYSKSTKEVKDMWIRKSDSFTAFCYDCLEEDIENKISKKDLKKRFFEYRKKHRLAGASEKAIKITLENMFGANEFQAGWGDRERFWEGIKFKNE
jgi:P4 family phage/plasmid primase-like protien